MTTAPPAPSAQKSALIEALLAFAAVSVLASVLFHLKSIAFVAANLHALVAAGFLLTPQLLLRLRRVPDSEDYGFRARPVGQGLVLFAATCAAVLPVFTAGFWLWHRLLCARWPLLVAGSCWRLLHPRLALPPELPMLVLAQVLVVAVPEELFFRGYLQTRLDEVWPRRWRILGAELGWGWLVGAALFGLGHFLVTFEPQMLSRFFPGLLFGWMFARTRSVLAGALFHAVCNLLMDVLALSFLS